MTRSDQYFGFAETLCFTFKAPVIGIITLKKYDATIERHDVEDDR